MDQNVKDDWGKTQKKGTGEHDVVFVTLFNFQQRPLSFKTAFVWAFAFEKESICDFSANSQLN